MGRAKFKNLGVDDIEMYRVVARGHRRKLITYVSTSHDLIDIGIPAGVTGQISAKQCGNYIVRFDDKKYGSAMLNRDEFVVLKQKLDMSKTGVK